MLLLATCTASDSNLLTPPEKVFCIETVQTVASGWKVQQNSRWQVDPQPKRRLEAAFFLLHPPCEGWGPNRPLLICPGSLVPGGFGNRELEPPVPPAVCRSASSKETSVPAHLEGLIWLELLGNRPPLPTPKATAISYQNSLGYVSDHMDFTGSTISQTLRGSSKYSKYFHFDQLYLHCS